MKFRVPLPLLVFALLGETLTSHTKHARLPRTDRDCAGYLHVFMETANGWRGRASAHANNPCGLQAHRT